MIESVLKNLDYLKNSKKKEMREKVDQLDIVLLRQLSNWLGNCHELRLWLTVDKEPTLDRLMAVRTSLKQLANDYLVGTLEPLKKYFDMAFEKIKYTEHHLAASFLNPTLKDSNCLSRRKIAKAKEKIYDIFEDLVSKGFVTESFAER